MQASTAASWTQAIVARAGGASSDSVLAGINPTRFDSANPIRLFIIQIVIIIVLCRALAAVGTRLRQPTVIAEVIAGILLGPTVLGRIPGFSKTIFPPQSLPYLNVVANLGLIFFLFLVGLETDLRVMKRTLKVSGTISLVGMVVPFGLGAAVSRGIYDTFVNKEAVTFGHFLLFTGVAMSITAFPVLARILTETKLLYTRVGVITLAAGVGNDVVGWILLALTIALVNATSGVIAVYTLLCAVAWTLVLFFAVKPAFLWLVRRTGSFENGPTQLMITATLLLVLISSWVTDIIGVHAIFGAFLVGLIVPHEGGYAVAMTEKIEDLVAVIFLPIYFTLSGIKTNLGYLDTGLIWGYTIAIITVAFFSKFGGCTIAAKLLGFSNREAGAIGTLMSCKGLVELIVLNIGLSAGILDTRVFSMFVLMAIITTVTTTPLALWFYPEEIREPADEFYGDGDAQNGKKHSTHDRTGSSAFKKGGRGGRQAEEAAYGKHAHDLVSLGSKNLMVVLTGFEHLPGLMKFVRLIQPSLAVSEAMQGSQDATSGLRRRQVAAGHRASNSHATTQESMDEKDDGDASSRSSDENRSVPASSSSSSSLRPLSIDALRLIELTDRTSAVMRVAESEDTMRADPISNVFRTFAQLHRLPVQSWLSVVATEYFPSTVVSRARKLGSDLVILPWTIPAEATGGAVGSQDEQQASAGFMSALSSPFEGIFGRTAAGANSGANGAGGVGSSTGTASASGSEAMRNLPQQAALARKLIQTAETDVGLLVGGSSDGMKSLGGHEHVLFGFMGGPDDRTALQLVARFCSINTDLRVTILHLQRGHIAAAAAKEASNSSAGGRLPTVPPTLHHANSMSLHLRGPPELLNDAGLTVHDTIYHRTTGGNSGYRGGDRPGAADDAEASTSPLQSQLEDDLAIKSIKEDAHLADALSTGRLQIKEVCTATPLTTLLKAVKREVPSLVVVGRGRRNPTMGSHRDELRVLLALGLHYDDVEDADDAEREERDAAAAAGNNNNNFSTTRLINGDACKVVGEVAFALHATTVALSSPANRVEPSTSTTRRGLGVTTLVVASSIHRAPYVYAAHAGQDQAKAESVEPDTARSQTAGEAAEVENKMTEAQQPPAAQTSQQ